MPDADDEVDEEAWENALNESDEEEIKDEKDGKGIDSENLNLRIGTKRNISTFKKMALMKASKDAEQVVKSLLQEQGGIHPFTLSIFPEILMMKISIDLNFLSVPDFTFHSLGFKTDVPVDLILYLDDNKMINWTEEDLINLEFNELIGLGLLKMESHQNDNLEYDSKF